MVLSLVLRLKKEELLRVQNRLHLTSLVPLFHHQVLRPPLKLQLGLSTESTTLSGGIVTLDLTKDAHKVTATGITTITCTGGTEGNSHIVRIINSGITTVGFSSYFLFPSGASPVLPTADGSFSQVSFQVHREGSTGIGTTIHNCC